MTTRRDFLAGASSAGLSSALPSGAAAQASAAQAGQWDQGRLMHLLPTVSHNRFLLKASFDGALDSVPELKAGSVRVRGQKNTARGDFWQFDVPGLEPGTPYRLSLTGGDGRPLC